MSYSFGAMRNGRGLPLDGFGAASGSAAQAEAALRSEFARFAQIITQAAADIQDRDPDQAGRLRAGITRFRAGMENVIKGTLSGTFWAQQVDAFIALARDDAPWFSWTSARSAAESVGSAARTAAVEAARAAGQAVRAAGEGAGLTREDLERAAAAAEGTIKMVAGAGIVLGLTYLVFITPKPSRK